MDSYKECFGAAIFTAVIVGIFSGWYGIFFGVAVGAYFGDCDRLFRDNPITSVSRL